MKTVSSKFLLLLEASKEILWRFAEVHLSKLILLILTLIAVNDVSFYILIFFVLSVKFIVRGVVVKIE